MDKNIFENLTGPLSIITPIVGGIFWLTSLHNRAKENEKEIDSIKVEFRDFETRAENDLSDLEVKLSKVEAQLSLILESHKKPLQ